VEQSTDPAALDAVRVIYESSFPPEERADFDGVADAVRAGARRLFVARDGDGAVAGFGVTRSMEPAGAHLLEYLAVAEGRRDGGLGGNLLDGVVGALRELGEAAVLLIEVEPADDGPDEQRPLRARRLGFYERHGARVVECAPGYRAPRFDGPGELRYVLMWVPLADGVEPPRGEGLRAMVAALLVDGYGLDPDDRLVGAVLGGLAC
jgi:ribosomal protein S18 acetylase RimI-like enzyme